MESVLRAQEARLLAAMRTRDLDMLLQIFDPAYVFTSGSGRVWGCEQALQDFRDPGFWLDQLEIVVDRVIPLPGAGVVIGWSRVAGWAGGASVSGQYRFTRVWRFADGKWTILAAHTSPCNFPE